MTACATVSPSASQSAAEKSMPSRTTVECAVRKIVVAISSAIDASALPTISCVIGSTPVRGAHVAAPGSSVSVATSRRTVQPGRTTTVVSYSSTSSGPGSGALADRRARADGQLAEHRRSRVALPTGRQPSARREPVDGARRARAPRAAARGSRSASPPRRGPRTAARARPRTRRSARAQVDRVADARPRSPRSARRSAARRPHRTRARRPSSARARRARAKTASSVGRRRPRARRGGTCARRGTPAARRAARAS